MSSQTKKYGIKGFFSLDWVKDILQPDRNILGEDKIESFKIDIKRYFALFNEVVLDLNDNPALITRTITFYRDLTLFFSIALAYPELKYNAIDGFGMLSDLLIGDIQNQLKIQEPDLDEKANKLFESIADLIDKQRKGNYKNFSLDVIEVAKKNFKVSKSEIKPKEEK